LIGDAAHATVPFYGQGMNAGFEDCTVLNDLMIQHGENWPKIFKEYSLNRKPDGDALQDLSLDNYYVMRDYVADPDFLLRKKIEAKFSELYPEKWLPLYSQVTFSEIRYSDAYRQGQVQNQIMDQIMGIPDIHEKWENPDIMNQMLKLCM
jgi:kynurenine 3-monooxygenase